MLCSHAVRPQTHVSRCAAAAAECVGDGQVVCDFCAQHLEANKAAFADPRLELIYDDARAQLEQSEGVHSHPWPMLAMGHELIDCLLSSGLSSAVPQSNYQDVSSPCTAGCTPWQLVCWL